VRSLMRIAVTRTASLRTAVSDSPGGCGQNRSDLGAAKQPPLHLCGLPTFYPLANRVSPQWVWSKLYRFGVCLYTPSQHTRVSLYSVLRSEGVEEGPSGLASPLPVVC
jgi:hypothetical protein